jgi:hypothetical protein
LILEILRQKRKIRRQNNWNLEAVSVDDEELSRLASSTTYFSRGKDGCLKKGPVLWFCRKT